MNKEPIKLEADKNKALDWLRKHWSKPIYCLEDLNDCGASESELDVFPEERQSKCSKRKKPAVYKRKLGTTR